MHKTPRRTTVSKTPHSRHTLSHKSHHSRVTKSLHKIKQRSISNHPLFTQETEAAPQDAPQNLVDWTQKRSKIEHRLQGSEVQYNSSHTAILDEILSPITDATGSPWRHQDGTYAHPALPYIILPPLYQSGHYKVDTNTTTIAESYGTPRPQLDNTTEDSTQWNIHAKIGGKINFYDDISARNQRLIALAMPPFPPIIKRTTNHKLDNTTDNSNGYFVKSTTSMALCTQNMSQVVELQHTNAFLPSSSSSSSSSSPLIHASITSDDPHGVQSSYSQKRNKTSTMHAESILAEYNMHSKMYTTSSAGAGIVGDNDTNDTNNNNNNIINNAIFNTLERKYSHDRRHDWSLNDIILTSDTIDKIHKYTNISSHPLLSSSASSSSETNRYISPDILAIYALEFLGVVSQDSAPKRVPFTLETLQQRVSNDEKSILSRETLKKRIQEELGLHDNDDDDDDTHNTNTSTGDVTDNEEQNHKNKIHPRIKAIEYMADDEIDQQLSVEDKQIIMQKCTYPPFHRMFQPLKTFEYKIPCALPRPRDDSPIKLSYYAKIIENKGPSSQYIESIVSKLKKQHESKAKGENIAYSDLVLMKDLFRSGPLSVRVWAEGHPYVSREITSHTVSSSSSSSSSSHINVKHTLTQPPQGDDVDPELEGTIYFDSIAIFDKPTSYKLLNHTHMKLNKILAELQEFKPSSSSPKL